VCAFGRPDAGRWEFGRISLEGKRSPLERQPSGRAISTNIIGHNEQAAIRNTIAAASTTTMLAWQERVSLHV
jgi:hypothetical protein